MPAGDRDFDGALHVPLALHVREIDVVIFVGGEERGEIAVGRRDERFAPNELEGLAKIVNAINGDPFHHRGLVRVDRRDKDRLLLLAPRFERHRQHAFHRAHCAIERRFADEAVFLERRAIQFLGHGDQLERDRQIEARPFFFDIGRREIDRGPSPRPMVALLMIAVVTRSWLSFTAVSGKPTIIIFGLPCAPLIWSSTS